MHLLRSLLAALAATCIVIAPAMAQGADARVIVKLKPGSAMLRSTILSVDQRQASQAEALGTRIGIALRAGAGLADRTQLVVASGISAQALAERIAREPDVEYAVVDERRHPSAAPNDPRYGNNLVGVTPTAGQWYLRPNDATFVSAINAEQAWNITTGSAQVVVAVLDSGIRADHPDLAGNLLAGYDLISDTPTANDGGGRDANPADEGDWLTQTEINNNPSSFSGCTPQATSSWHGTQVAGLIGALTDNNIGMASVGRNVRVLPVRVLGKCGGFDIDIVAGMRWAAGLSVPGLPINANPANVINMSLGGGTTCSQTYLDAINEIHAARPGTVIVASAGNSAGHPVTAPANCPGMVAVGAVRHTGTKVGFSDMGPEVAITAPGGNCVNSSGACLYPILTTTNSGSTTPVSNGAGGSSYTDSFDASLGTSFSAPLVAGTAGLMLSQHPGLTHSQLTLAMQIGSRPFPTSGAGPGVGACPTPQPGVDVIECYCTTSTCGAGLLDAFGALGVVNTTRAFFDVGPVSPVPTQTITLSAALSFAAPGRNLIGYSWSLAPTSIATFTSATNQPTATVVASASGSFDVTLTVFDNQGGSSSETQRITVQVASGGGSGGGGGGGGALGVPWLLALGLAVWALRRRPLR